MIKVKESSLEDAFSVHKLIPEFTPNPPTTYNEFSDKVKGKKYHCFIAYINNKPAGYLVSYDKYYDRSIYVWLGAVVPKYRRKGVMKKLMQKEEKIAKKEDYKSIKVKTWNKRVEMRVLLAKNGYNVIGFEKKKDALHNRLLHEKKI